MSEVSVLKCGDYLALEFPYRCKALSSAVLNGGLSEASSFLNLRVNKDAPPPWPSPEKTLSDKAIALGLACAPEATVAMMTAASMQTLGHSAITKADLTVECWVTTGLGNLRSVGDTADEAPVAGTINIALLINQALSDAAMAEALILLTEAKVTAIQQADLLSPVSNKPASGTGTDSHAVFARQQGELVSYCGKHTLLGELIGRAVFAASAQSIAFCLAESA